MSGSLLKRFSPYRLPNATIDALATGRQHVLDDILGHVAANLRSRPPQHLQVIAPRGFGKSFLMLMVQNSLSACAAAGLPVAGALFEAAGNRGEQAEALRYLRWNLGQHGEHDGGIATLREAAEHATETDRERHLPFAIGNALSAARASRSRPRHAAELFAVGVKVAHEAGDMEWASTILGDIVDLALRDGTVAKVWQVVAANPSQFRTKEPVAAEVAGARIAAIDAEQGRATGYAAASGLINTLIKDQSEPPAGTLTATSFLRGCHRPIGDVTGPIARHRRSARRTRSQPTSGPRR